MDSRVQLSTSSGCRGVARLKMGSSALMRQNEGNRTWSQEVGLISTFSVCVCVSECVRVHIAKYKYCI